MESGWEPEQQDHLGALGLAGICRETNRVVRGTILPNFSNQGAMLLSAILLANTAARSALSSLDVAGKDVTSLLRLQAVVVCVYLLEILILGLLLFYTAAYVLSSPPTTGGDLLATDHVIKEDYTVVRLTRFLCTFLLVEATFLVVSTYSPVAVALLRVWLKVETVLALRLLGWASAAYHAMVGQLACVVSLLEDAALFSAVRRSRELLAGKFWPAACVFVTLDGCILVVLMAFQDLVLDDALGFGLAFQVAAGAAMFVVLSAVLVVTLVAQPVVYVVCKSHHQEVVDRLPTSNRRVMARSRNGCRRRRSSLLTLLLLS